MKSPLFLMGSTLLGMAMNAALADEVGGSPKADFNTDELTIPCVKVESLSEQTEGKYYDIVLVRRGDSYNYELTAAQLEDTALCELVAATAGYEDEDFVPGGGEGPVVPEPAMLAQCHASPERTAVTVLAKHLDPGDYEVMVSSGDNVLESEIKTIAGQAVRFAFSSGPDADAEGAEAIDADFLVDDAVSVDLFVAGEPEALLSTTVNCLVEDDVAVE